MKLKINNDLKVLHFFHWRILNNNIKNNSYRPKTSYRQEQRIVVQRLQEIRKEVQQALACQSSRDIIDPTPDIQITQHNTNHQQQHTKTRSYYKSSKPTCR